MTGRYRVITLLFVTTVVAVLVRYVPHRGIRLVDDWARPLSDGTPEGLTSIEKHFDRSSQACEAWAVLEQANRLWDSKRRRKAINKWWSVVERFPDTDARDASLCNIASAERFMGNEGKEVGALLTLAMLPEPSLADRGSCFYECRYDGLLLLSEHYEQIRAYDLAENLLVRAMYSKQSPMCGIEAMFRHQQSNARLSRLRELQDRNCE